MLCAEVVNSHAHGGGGKHVWDSEVCHLGADVGDLEVGMWRVDGWWWPCGSCRSLLDYVHVRILDIVIFAAAGATISQRLCCVGTLWIQAPAHGVSGSHVDVWRTYIFCGCFLSRWRPAAPNAFAPRDESPPQPHTIHLAEFPFDRSVPGGSLLWLLADVESVGRPSADAFT